MKKTLIIILFIFSKFFVFAQIPEAEVKIDISIFPKEIPTLFINSNLLLTGEALQYKILIQNASPNPQVLSKIAYVSLRNESDSIVFNHKLGLNDGVANSDFFVPSSLKTGVYRLIGYTNFSRNNSVDGLDEKLVYIINTFKKNNKSPVNADTVSVKKVVQKDKNPMGQKDMELKIAKQSFGPRERVDLIINKSKIPNGKYTLSVRLIAPVQVANLATESINPKTTKFIFLPELRGELISGVIVSKIDNKPVFNKVVALTIPGKDYIFKLSKTDKNGRFFFSLMEVHSLEKGFIQIYDPGSNREDYKIVMDKKELILENRMPSHLNIDPGLKEWLEERSVQIQIENAYFDKKEDSILALPIDPLFYDNLGTVYHLNNFTRFPSIRETFVEIIKLAAVRGSGESTRFMVYNEYDPKGIGKFNDIPPLVLLDGMPIQNNVDFLDFNASNIRSIRVINQPYRYGPKIFSGIIAVEAFEDKFFPTNLLDNTLELDIPALERPKILYSPEYGKSVNLKRIPDYRVQLLWLPNLELLEDTFTYSFYTSDILGVYEIRLEGYTEAGKSQEYTGYFEVH